MNLWSIKAKLYHSMRKRSIFQYILHKENRNFYLLLNKLPKLTGKIVDLGCGDGNIIEILNRHFPNTSITGMDISSAMLHNIAKNSTTQLIQGNICKTPFKNNSFELCTAIGLSEYLKNKDIFMHNLNKIVTIDGYAIITFSQKNIFTYMRLIHGIRLYPADKSITSQIISNNGFTIIEHKKSLMQLQYLIKKVSDNTIFD